ncbi:unnamed protein product [Dibothriocephalus latus]|uniref:Uncharacterized protein n=1 Tax=Dibothriocephalus latus TaxID=60516 RepID=A0A3P7PCD3_DIBLA|nr:unnamed protein product [Dibothriocephalus latus]
MGKEPGKRFTQQMTRAPLDYCHQSLNKHRAVSEQNRKECTRVFCDFITGGLAQAVAALAQQNMLQPPDIGSSNLGHDLSSKQLTEQQLRVLQHEVCVNTADANPVDFILDVETKLVRTETIDDENHSIQQRVASMLMTHRPAQCVPQNKSTTIKDVRTGNHIIILPADKGRPTVLMNREYYNEKSKGLLDDR